MPSAAPPGLIAFLTTSAVQGLRCAPPLATHPPPHPRRKSGSGSVPVYLVADVARLGELRQRRLGRLRVLFLDLLGEVGGHRLVLAAKLLPRLGRPLLRLVLHQQLT